MKLMTDVKALLYIFRTSPWVTHVVRVGDLVLAGTVLAIPCSKS